MRSEKQNKCQRCGRCPCLPRPPSKQDSDSEADQKTNSMHPQCCTQEPCKTESPPPQVVKKTPHAKTIWSPWKSRHTPGRPEKKTSPTTFSDKLGEIQQKSLHGLLVSGHEPATAKLRTDMCSLNDKFHQIFSSTLPWVAEERYNEETRMLKTLDVENRDGALRQIQQISLFRLSHTWCDLVKVKGG